MKEFKITEEQIKENKDLTLKEYFKEVFETKLEVNKWYVVENIQKGSLGFCGIGMFTNENHESGLLDFESGFNFQAPNGMIWRVNGDIRLATEEEVFDALKKEAEKRGYKVGSRVKCLADGEIEYICYINYDFGLVENSLFINNNCLIFENGKWAEIIEQPEEIIELNGVKYKRID